MNLAFLLLVSMPQNPADVPGHSIISELLANGTSMIASVTSQPLSGLTASSEPLSARIACRASEGYRASALWVDRAHQNAIAEETVISGGGEGIFASWYLNSTRLSRYVTCGSSTPQWTYPVSTGGGSVDIAAATDIAWTATNNVLGTLAWLGSGSSPSMMTEAGLRQDISEDGTRLVFVDTRSNLVCMDTGTQAVIWEVPLITVGNGIYGVDISDDASRVLVSAYDASSGAQVYNMTNGAGVGSPVGNYGQTKGAISGDGSRIVTGDFNGRVKMYQWSGSVWQLAAQISSGDNWVTAVAISGDGHTVAGGTLGFSPYRGRVLCIDWPGSGTPATAWQYSDYGDEVSSVAICSDGSVIVAGSWGKLDSTDGDVFTAFDHDGGVIFSLLDDIDEPGSIFSVDISTDGSFATASGKAVHARTMGSGGQVYSFQIMDIQQHDVGVVAVISPTENQQVGNVVTPQVTVGNLGMATESFTVSAILETVSGTQVWSDNASVSSLAPGQETNVTFDAWTVPGYGSWIFRAQTLLSTDTCRQNDTLSVGVRACHDAAALSIVCPYAENTAGMAMIPVVSIMNGGTYTENISVTMSIDLEGSQVYTQTLNVTNVAPGATVQASMPAWTPASTGSCQADASVTVTDDLNPDNDDATLPFDIVNEIIYEDGEWDSYYWVGTQDDDMFATRFTPTIDPPFTATLFRVFVNSTESFDWAALCLDDGTGRPDFANPLYLVEGLSASAPLTWLEVPMDIWINEPGDLWFVTRWPDSKALAVGSDLDVPRTGRSWWHNTTSGWVNFTSGDWSFRLTLEPATGIEDGSSPGVFSLGIPTPNPSSGLVNIPVSAPEPGAAMRLAIYDLAGRCVSIISDGPVTPGEHLFVWNCTAESGPAAPSGLYFIRLDAPGCTETGRMILIR